MIIPDRIRRHTMLALLLTCLLLVSAGSVLSRALERQTTCVADGNLTAELQARQLARASEMIPPGTDVIQQDGRAVGEGLGATWDSVKQCVRFQQLRVKEGFRWESAFEFRSRRLELDTFDIATEAGTGDPQNIRNLSRVVCHWVARK